VPKLFVVQNNLNCNCDIRERFISELENKEYFNIIITHSSAVVKERVELSTPPLSLHGRLEGEIFFHLYTRNELLRMDPLRADLLKRLGK
jgi:hypothetical protein